jgi:hypothetical protein
LFRYIVSPQITLGAEVHLAEKQFLLEEQSSNTEKSLIYRAGTRKPSFQKRLTKIEAKVNLSKEECIEVMPPLM